MSDDAFFEFRAVVKFLVLLGASNGEIWCKLSEAYGDAAPSMPFVIKWGKRFRDGRESLRDDPRAGRPRKTGGLATAIADLLEEHPFESTRSLADALGFSRETIRLALHDELGLRRFVLRWVLHALNPAQKQQRVADARKLLEHLESPGGCESVITEDESWVYHEYAHDSRWAASAVDAGTRVAQTIASKKSMISVFWSIRGVISSKFSQLETASTVLTLQGFSIGSMRQSVNRVQPQGSMDSSSIGTTLALTSPP